VMTKFIVLPISKVHLISSSCDEVTIFFIFFQLFVGIISVYKGLIPDNNYPFSLLITKMSEITFVHQDPYISNVVIFTI
jgi:hypothetical protein